MQDLAISLSLVYLSIVAALDGNPAESLANYGFAGILLGMLFWFLRALVNNGVKPFVESTIKNQQSMATAMEKQVTALESIHQSSEKVSALVASMDQQLRDHMVSDARVDKAILDELTLVSPTARRRASAATAFDLPHDPSGLSGPG